MVEPVPAVVDVLGMVTSYAGRYAEMSDQLRSEHGQAVAALRAEEKRTTPVDLLAPVVPLRGWRR